MTDTDSRKTGSGGEQVANVFISHGSDNGPTEEIRRWLVTDGHEVFLDNDLRDGIRVGDEWEQRLQRLRWADAVVCVVTSEFVASTWCAAEVGAARTRGCKVLPILAEPHLEDPLLSSIQHIDMARDPNAARRALSEALMRVDASGGGGWPDGKSPFPGLRPFDIDMRSVFFGRSSEIGGLLEVLRSPVDRAEGTVLLVVGPSGCGKSSLVRAGLVPMVAQEPGWWTAPPFSPGTDPVRSLARSLASTAVRAGLDRSVEQVLAQFDDIGLLGAADEILLAAPGGTSRRLLIVVDQFEELVTQAGRPERSRFVGLIRAALAGPVQVLVTVRPEFLDQLLAEPELAVLPVRPHLVRPLRRDALRVVIEGPARLAGITVSDDLVARLVADTESGEALPLLAFTLSQLAQGVERGDELSATRYEQLGGVQGALTRQADAALDDAMRATGRDNHQVIDGLLRLVTVDEQGRPTRWRVSRDELAETVAIELDAFIARRLLTTDIAESGKSVVSVAHEAFLTAWPPLVDAISASASALRARREVERDAEVWQLAGRPAGRLWERGQLAAAIADTGAVIRHRNDLSNGKALWAPGGAARSDRATDDRRVVVTDRIPISSTAGAFLLASMRRDRLRRGRAAIILSILLIAALGAAGLLVVQLRATQEQQRLATAHQLVSRAEGIRVSEPQTSLMLGIAADQIHHDEQTTGALVESLMSTRYAGTLAGHNWDVGTPTFSADGRTMLTAGPTSGLDIQLILWDIGNGRPRQLAPALTSDVEPAGLQAFSPDGQLLATSRSDQTIVLWDISDLSAPHPIGSPIPAAGEQLAEMGFAPDSRTLAVGTSYPATAVLWDVSNPTGVQRLGDPITVGTSLDLLQFNSSGSTLLTGASSADFQDSIVLWDITDRAVPRPVGNPIPYDGTSAFDPRTQILATDNPDSSSPEVTLWDLKNPTSPRQIESALSGPSSSSAGLVQFSQDGSMLAIAGQTSSDGGTVRIWDIEDPDRPRPIEQPAEQRTTANSSSSSSTSGGLPGTGPYPLLSSPITAVSFVVDTNAVAIVSRRGDHSHEFSVSLWDFADPAAPEPIGEPIDGTTTLDVGGVSFFPDGRTLFTSRGNGAILLWDLADPDAPQQIGPALTGTGSVGSIAYLPGAGTLAIGRSDGSVVQHDLSDPSNDARAVPLLAASGEDLRVSIAPRTGLIAVSGKESVTITDPHNPGRGVIAKPFFPGKGGEGNPTVLGFSLDGRLLAVDVTTIGSSVTLWDVSDSAHPTRAGPPLRASDFYSLIAFSPDGRVLVNRVGAGPTTGVALIDISNPSLPVMIGAALTGHADTVEAIAVSPDGTLLATSGSDSTVILWDLTQPQQAHQIGLPLTGFGGTVESLAFSPDGRTLATAVNSSVSFWDLTDDSQPRRLGTPLSGLTGGTTTLVFSADGDELAGGDTEGTVIRWDLTGLAQLRANSVAAACARTGRGLSPAEWSLYVPDLDYETTCTG